MTSSRRNTAPLIFGLILILAGSLLLAARFYELPFGWRSVLKFVFPVLFLAAGMFKLIRHYAWSEEELLKKPLKAGLLGGLFWTSLGTLILLDIMGVVETLSFIGLYWPVLLILFGLGKIIDFYRLQSRIQVRAGEIFGVIFIVLFGLTAAQISKAHFPLLRLNLPGIPDWPVSVDMAMEKHRFENEESRPAEGLEAIRINNLYGDVRVEPGLSDRVEVILSKVIREVSEEKARHLADRLQLSLRSEGNQLLVETNRERIGEQGRKVNTHLVVRAPASLRIDVSNSYGKVEVGGIQADCSVFNSYGETILDSITGTVNVSGKYEGIEVRHVNGDVKVSNRQARITVEDVSGSLTVETDHDLITAGRIGGNLQLSNRFGTVRLEEVGGSAVIVAPGSQVTLSRMKQGVRVENSHQGVIANDLSAGLDLQTAYSRVNLSGIEGKVSVKANHSEIFGENLHSDAVIEARGSEVSLLNLSGPVQIVTSLRRVSVERFDGPLEIQNEFAEIRIEAKKPLSRTVRATNRNGGIILAVPSDSSFELAARAKGGQIVSDFAPNELKKSGDSSTLESKVGPGGPTVQLETVHSDIRIEKRG